MRPNKLMLAGLVVTLVIHRDQARDGDSVVLESAARWDSAACRRRGLVPAVREIAGLVTP